MIMGAFLCDGGVTATLANLIGVSDMKAAHERMKKECLSQYSKSRSFPQDLREKIRNMLEYTAKVSFIYLMVSLHGNLVVRAQGNAITLTYLAPT